LSLFHIDAGREWRGGQRQSFFLVRELQRKGWPLTFVVQPRRPLFERASAEGLPVLARRMRSELGLLAALRIAAAMRRRKCCLVHCHDAHSAAVGLMAASLAGVPLRVVSRRVDFPLRRNALTRRKYDRGVDAVIAISQGVKRVLVEGGVPPEKVEVVPSGIDFSVYDGDLPRDYLHREYGFSESDYLVGIVAQLEDHKGHRYLLEAARILMQRARRIKVVIVGEGSLRLELTKQADRLEVKDVVYFLGFREDVPRILASLNLFVLSSHLEGLGSSLLDAMACRLPVVATRAGGIPEVVQHGKTGLLVPPKDPEALAEAILALYRNRGLASRLGLEGYIQVQAKFSVESTAARTADVYRRAAERRGVPLEKPS
jgi:glycosyltransferase involved in cell wall biosynthesis